MDNELILFDRIHIIQDVIKKYGEENFYISFSGGKDSTVLHYLLDEAIPGNEIPRIFCDTGIEYDLIKKFVLDLSKTDKRIKVIQPSINVKQMLEKALIFFDWSGGKQMNAVEKVRKAFLNGRDIDDLYNDCDKSYLDALNDVQAELDKEVANDWEDKYFDLSVSYNETNEKIDTLKNENEMYRCRILDVENKNIKLECRCDTLIETNLAIAKACGGK